jgi:hypothetical protein
VRRPAVAIAALLIAPAVALGACPRPSGPNGPRYAVISGIYEGRGVSKGGGEFLTLLEEVGAAPVSVGVTDAVFDAAGKIAIGSRIALFSYVSHAMSGSAPPYSCMELQ